MTTDSQNPGCNNLNLVRRSVKGVDSNSNVVLMPGSPSEQDGQRLSPHWTNLWTNRARILPRQSERTMTGYSRYWQGYEVEELRGVGPIRLTETRLWSSVRHTEMHITPGNPPIKVCLTEPDLDKDKTLSIYWYRWRELSRLYMQRAQSSAELVKKFPNLTVVDEVVCIGDPDL